MSETLRDLVVSLSLNSDNFTRNIKSINKQIQEAESAFRLASAGVENFETTTAGLSSKLSTLQRTFQLQQDAVGQYERALQQASDKLQECYARQNDYAQRLVDAKDKQQLLKTEVLTFEPVIFSEYMTRNSKLPRKMDCDICYLRIRDTNAQPVFSHYLVF